ncbi:sortase [Candidatus Saccharibacteria bacterium]|nr:sortase [Candidatus Saccharibacteria bacterium]
MDEHTEDTTHSNRTPHSRGVPQRPPIQWPERAVHTGDDTRAAELARTQLDRTYLRDGQPNEPKQQPEPQASQPTHLKHSKNHVEPQKHVAEQPQHVMREEPYDWQQYHTAWQQYYHQYFYRYYSGWWQQQRGQLEASRQSQAAVINAQAVFAQKETEPPLSDSKKITKELREKIRTTARKGRQRVQSSSHFKPLIGAMLVAVLFLTLNYNQVMIGKVKQYIAPGNVVTTPVIVEPNASAAVGPDPKIIIPKIGVEVPVVYDEPRVDEPSYQKALERGVVRLGNTANPGTKGNVVIGGHSSNNVFNPGKYKYVFVNLKQLQVGDIFYLNYGGTRYTYKVTVANKIIRPNETSALNQTDVPTVTLFTCDPPGTNVNRLIVQGVQIDPNPDQAVVNENTQTDTSSTNPLPSVAPSLWDRLFNR